MRAGNGAWAQWPRSWADCRLEGDSLGLDGQSSFIGPDWQGWRVGEGGLVPWPSPKPASPQHLETIIGTMIAVQTWLLGSAAVCSESRGMGSHTSGPHLPTNVCLGTSITWLLMGSAVENSQPELQTWRLIARAGAPEPGQTPGDPSSTPCPACHIYGL